MFRKGLRFDLLSKEYDPVIRCGGSAQGSSWTDDPLVEAQFGGVSRLYGTDSLSTLMASRACVVGIGGVGGWTAEAMVRSGVGCITLVDMDEVCISNANRQVHALPGTVGLPKVEVLATRLAQINPHCEIRCIHEFLTAENAHEILSGDAFDVVVDAIDTVQDKCALLLECQALEIPLVVVGGAGGRSDPTSIRCADLTKTTHCRLIAQLRKRLRQHHGFQRGSQGDDKWGIRCVYSIQQPRRVTVTEGLVGCDGAFGTSCAVTGAFGFAAASAAMEVILAPSMLA